MVSEFNGNLVPVAAMVIPVIGSIGLFTFLSVAVWSDARRKEREAYYTGEALKKVAEGSGEGAKGALELMREQHRNAMMRKQEGMKLGGLITAAVGLGTMVLLRGIANEDGPVYLAGLIPLLVGLVLAVYAFVLAPKTI